MSHFGRQYAYDYIKEKLQEWCDWADEPVDCDCCGGGDEYWDFIRRDIQAAVDYLRKHKYPLPRIHDKWQRELFDEMLKYKAIAWEDYYVKP